GLWSVSLTESGLAAIATLQQLRTLRLDGMPVSARWLEKLKTLPHIERLTLQGCKRLTDDALPVLASFPALRSVDLKGTGVSETGVDALRQAKPNCQVLHGPWEGPNLRAR
ncbi:MAG: hypothetical protein ACREN5_00620, partial [Gemmatimonadales bacterium]